MADHRPDGAPSLASILLALLGASAGITFFLYVVGALLEFRRLQTLHLAAQDVVPALSQQTLLVLAAHALLVPLALGATASAMLLLLRTPRATALVRAVAALVVVASIALLPFLGWRDRAAVVAAAAADIAGWAAVVRGSWSVRGGATAAFAAAALLGAVVAFVNAWLPPVRLACARLTLTEGPAVEGFFVGASSNDFFIAPGKGRRSVRRVYVVPRSRVVRLDLQETVAVRDGGAGTARSVDC